MYSIKVHLITLYVLKLYKRQLSLASLLHVEKIVLLMKCKMYAGRVATLCVHSPQSPRCSYMARGQIRATLFEQLAVVFTINNEHIPLPDCCRIIRGIGYHVRIFVTLEFNHCRMSTIFIGDICDTLHGRGMIKIIIALMCPLIQKENFIRRDVV